MDNQEYRDATPKEWAARLLEGDITEDLLASALSLAIDRGYKRGSEQMRRRFVALQASVDLALEHFDDRNDDDALAILNQAYKQSLQATGA